jgi:hypothetical protein
MHSVFGQKPSLITALKTTPHKIFEKYTLLFECEKVGDNYSFRFSS